MVLTPSPSLLERFVTFPGIGCVWSREKQNRLTIKKPLIPDNLMCSHGEDVGFQHVQSFIALEKKKHYKTSPLAYPTVTLAYPTVQHLLGCYGYLWGKDSCQPVSANVYTIAHNKPAI